MGWSTVWYGGGRSVLIVPSACSNWLSFGMTKIINKVTSALIGSRRMYPKLIKIRFALDSIRRKPKYGIRLIP